MTTNQIQAAIYARVSTEQQTETQTVASQLAALRLRVAADGLKLCEELTFIDAGYSGATLVRPALERLRDLAFANGNVFIWNINAEGRNRLQLFRKILRQKNLKLPSYAGVLHG
ncbi:recombinase family protein [Desmonostoc muscorum LEGE 12446]|uniref:Recombinase family protein n=1 Tax=Desmonostoc muscorum LEGE 12446 TaxID=1828758 RepID=A0A8J6ZNA8_DESMC|nr:recombinase family protein [Desmonostoc muscorum]MCF2151830.1 recombinase family protein [Desmonostoc muscorum LEGE 12446]